MNVFIAENSLRIRDSLQSVLADMPEVKVVGQATIKVIVFSHYADAICAARLGIKFCTGLNGALTI